MQRTVEAAWLAWYAAMGVDEPIGEAPVDRFAAPPAKTMAPEPIEAAQPTAAARTGAPPIVARGAGAASDAVTAAEACATFEDLVAAIKEFEGCPRGAPRPARSSTTATRARRSC